MLPKFLLKNCSVRFSNGTANLDNFFDSANFFFTNLELSLSADTKRNKNSYYNMDKNSYALGMSIAHNMLSSGVKDICFEDFTAGIKAVLEGAKPAVSFEEASELLDRYFAEIEGKQKAEMAAMSAAVRQEGEEFLADNSKKDGVVVLPSGLQYKVVKEGTGKKPKANDKVKCHYDGRFVNGSKFDSSYDRGTPAVFGLNQVIPGWTEGLQLMSEGSKYELYIPYTLGYGEAGAPGAIPPYSTLVFTVELLEVL